MNYKIRVENEAESKEAQELFGSLGLTMNGWSAFDFPKYIANFVGGEFSDYSIYDSGLRDWEEITIPELRDLVVLKRNDPNDRNVEDKSFHDLYLSSENKLYYFHHGRKEWLLSKVSGVDSFYKVLKPITKEPIEKPMKEYLNKLTDGTYKLVVLSDVIDGHDGLIEIPEGADVATSAEAIYFWNTKNNTTYVDGEGWVKSSDGGMLSLDGYLTETDYKIIWQRHTQPEELPFVDDEPSLNDQYAEIEQVRQASIVDTLNERQSTYGSFEDVALTTQKIMDAIAWAGGQDKLPAPHHEALHMIASKMARIVNGDHNHKDSWHDIAGYATLVERLL